MSHFAARFPHSRRVPAVGDAAARDSAALRHHRAPTSTEIRLLPTPASRRSSRPPSSELSRQPPRARRPVISSCAVLILCRPRPKLLSRSPPPPGNPQEYARGRKRTQEDARRPLPRAPPPSAPGSTALGVHARREKHSPACEPSRSATARGEGRPPASTTSETAIHRAPCIKIRFAGGEF